MKKPSLCKLWLKKYVFIHDYQRTSKFLEFVRQTDKQDETVESQTNILYRLKKRPERQTGGKSFD